MSSSHQFVTHEHKRSREIRIIPLLEEGYVDADVLCGGSWLSCKLRKSDACVRNVIYYA
jgi:hypothetical protein